MSSERPAVVTAHAPARCAWCHGDLAGGFVECRGCRTVFHEDCGLNGCPTMGCVVRVEPALPQRPGISDYFFAVMGVLLAILTFHMLWKGESIPEPLTKDQGVFCCLMAIIRMVFSSITVVTWLRAHWGIRAAARSSFSRRPVAAKMRGQEGRAC